MGGRHNVQSQCPGLGEKSHIAVLGRRKPNFQFVIKVLESEALRPEKMLTRVIKMDDVVEHGMKALITEKG